MKYRTFIIAEIGQAHEGSLGIAHSYIDCLADAGVDAVKFQTHIAKAESSDKEKFRINFSYEDKNRYEYWKRMEFTPEQWKGLKDHCDEKNVEFISSPFSCAAVNMLEDIGVNRYKIGSGEISNYLMLQKIANTGKPIILSSGMSDYDELEKTILFLEPFGNQLSILQCTTAYPTTPEKWGIFEIERLRNKFKLVTGYSDHSANIAASTSAVALGAEIIEFHAVFSKHMFGPDSKASLDLNEIRQLTANIRNLERCKNSNESKDDISPYKDLKEMFGKTLAVNKDLKKGHLLTFEDLESKKPANEGVKASDFQSVLGKSLLKDLPAWSFITKFDIN